jgi:hypothetical protein
MTEAIQSTETTDLPDVVQTQQEALSGVVYGPPTAQEYIDGLAEGIFGARLIMGYVERNRALRQATAVRKARERQQTTLEPVRYGLGTVSVQGAI